MLTSLWQQIQWYDVGKDYLIPILTLMVSSLLSLFALYRTQVNAPVYAVITREGEVLSKKNFGRYGLFVEKIEFEGYPAYRLKFDKEPDYFDVKTRERAAVEVVNIGSNEYRVRFIDAGYGSSVEECNFVVQAY